MKKKNVYPFHILSLALCDNDIIKKKLIIFLPTYHMHVIYIHSFVISCYYYPVVIYLAFIINIENCLLLSILTVWGKMVHM